MLNLHDKSTYKVVVQYFHLCFEVNSMETSVVRFPIREENTNAMNGPLLCHVFTRGLWREAAGSCPPYASSTDTSEWVKDWRVAVGISSFFPLYDSHIYSMFPSLYHLWTCQGESGLCAFDWSTWHFWSARTQWVLLFIREPASFTESGVSTSPVFPAFLTWLLSNLSFACFIYPFLALWPTSLAW